MTLLRQSSLAASPLDANWGSHRVLHVPYNWHRRYPLHWRPSSCSQGTCVLGFSFSFLDNPDKHLVTSGLSLAAPNRSQKGSLLSNGLGLMLVFVLLCNIDKKVFSKRTWAWSPHLWGYFLSSLALGPPVQDILPVLVHLQIQGGSDLLVQLHHRPRWSDGHFCFWVANVCLWFLPLACTP